MIHPSYTELMAVINSEVEEGEQPLVQSRYSIVKATANRAKEIIDARSVEEKIAKARIEASNKEKEKEKDKDKIEEKRISKEDERKPSHYQSQLKNSTKVRLRFLEVQTRILHYN